MPRMKHLLACLTIFIAALCAGAERAGVPSVAVGGVFGVFTAGQRASFAVRGGGAMPYHVQDWRGDVVLRGVHSGDSPLLLPSLPPGYYTLGIGGGRRTFCVVPEPAGRAGKGSAFFAIYSGAAVGWKNISAEGRPEAAAKALCELVGISGIRHVRDSFSWKHANPEAGVFTSGNEAEKLWPSYHASGIACLNFLIHAPGWMCGDYPKLPSDLLGVYRSSRQLAAAGRDYGMEWEFWNESDLAVNAAAPAWHYAACLKAASLGVADGAPAAFFTLGGLSAMNGNYEHILLKNDVARYIDAFNLHFYNSPSRYAQYSAWARHQLKEAGFPGMPLIITETSTEAEGVAEASASYRRSADGEAVRIPAQSPRQEMLYAEFYPKSMLAWMHEGISRAYFFFLPPYNERGGKKDWGMMRRDGSVRPVYGAMAAMVHLLEDAAYAGSVKLPGGVCGHLLERGDGKSILVYWSPSPLDADYEWKTVDLSAGLSLRELVISGVRGSCEVYDVFGKRTEKIPEDGRVVLCADRYPAYLVGDFEVKEVRKGLPTPQIKVCRSADPGIDHAVVWDAFVHPEDFSTTDQNSAAFLRKDSGRIRIDAWNLSPESKRGAVSATGVLEGLPAEIQLGPWEKRSFQCVYRPSGKAFRDLLAIHCQIGQRRASALCIPVVNERFLYQSCRPMPLQTAQPSSWNRNASEPGMDIGVDPEEHCIRFTTRFKRRQSKWSYPEYRLLPEESMDGACAITFEIRSRQDMVENRGGAGVYAVTAEKESQYFKIAPPTDRWEERTVFLSSLKFPPEKIRIIRIGGNPEGQEYSVWVRNVKVYKSLDAVEGAKSAP